MNLNQQTTKMFDKRGSVSSLTIRPPKAESNVSVIMNNKNKSVNKNKEKDNAVENNNHQERKTNQNSPKARRSVLINTSNTNDQNPPPKRLFSRFYQKFSDNVEKCLEKDDEIKFIGNHRFNNNPNSLKEYLDEKHKGKIYNKFNEQYQKDKKDLELLDKSLDELEKADEITDNQAEILEKKKNLRDKRCDMLNKIELTPLPIVKKKIKDSN